MDKVKKPEGTSLKENKLEYTLVLIFGLFFIFPVLGFIIFAMRYDILGDKYLPLFFLGILIFSYIGFVTLRKQFEKISRISNEMFQELSSEVPSSPPQNGSDELQNIIGSFSVIVDELKKASETLKARSKEITTLKELSELCYVTFDPDEILYITLERALSLTNSDCGSVMILDGSDQKSFIVKASIGMGKFIKIGARVDFNASIAKYAVMNKSPLVVKDIEKDNRFGRTNRSQYGSKSFICMPIKTSKDILGVLTISRRDSEQFYVYDDVEILTPLISNASFTFENLLLFKENERRAMKLNALKEVFKVLNSSFREKELLRAILNEIQKVVPYDYAVILLVDKDRPQFMRVFDLIAGASVGISREDEFIFNGLIMDRVLKQESSFIVNDTGMLSNEVEKNLFANQGCTSCYFAPLVIESGAAGIMALCAGLPDSFHDAQDLLEWTAHALSLAMERDNLFNAVTQRNQEFETFRHIGGALASSTFDINKVLEYTMEMIREVMNVESGSLFLLEGDELVFAHAFNMDLETMKKFRLKMGQGIAGHVASKGQSIIVNEVEKSPYFYSSVDQDTGFRTRSAVCVPMISQGKVIGVIEVLNKTSGSFVQTDVDLLESISASVSIAMENSRLYNETLSMAENERNIRQMFQKFVPKEVLDKILHGADAEHAAVTIEEFKTLTMINIDIRGFSKIGKNLGTQKTVSLLNRFFSVMGGIVFQHHGIVDKYLGDGFMAIFGAPVSSTSDADNAVSAALEMKKSLGALNDFFDEEFGITLNIGISIHTGEVVVGNIGFDMKMDYTVIGDSVNALFRLQDLTKSIPNGILLSEMTLRATRSQLETRDIGATFDIDDAHGRLKIYELLGAKNNHSINSTG